MAWADPEKRREYDRDYRQRNRAKRTAQARVRRHADPEAAAAQSRAKRAARPDVYRQHSERWRQDHLDKAAEKARRNAPKRRARIAGAAIVEHVEPLVVLELHDGVCGICGEDVDPLSFHVDHVVPLARDGEHSYANVQPAHPVCNVRKGAR